MTTTLNDFNLGYTHAVDPNRLNSFGYPSTYAPVQSGFTLGSNLDGSSSGLLSSPQLNNTASATGEKSLLDSIFGSMLGKTDADGNKTDGWGGLALGGAQAGFNLWNGMKQFGLAEAQLKESKRQYDQNYAAQRKTLNTQMEDRQAARVASNPTAYESVGSYMQKNGI